MRIHRVGRRWWHDDSDVSTTEFIISHHLRLHSSMNRDDDIGSCKRNNNNDVTAAILTIWWNIHFSTLRYMILLMLLLQVNDGFAFTGPSFGLHHYNHHHHHRHTSFYTLSTSLYSTTTTTTTTSDDTTIRPTNISTFDTRSAITLPTAVVVTASSTIRNNHQNNNNNNNNNDVVVGVIHPSLGQSFRPTTAGEVSVTSFNVLAPSYHVLALDHSTTTAPAAITTTNATDDETNDDDDDDDDDKTGLFDDDDDVNDSYDNNDDDDDDSDESDDDLDGYVVARQQDGDDVMTKTTTNTITGPSFSSDNDDQQLIQQRVDQFLYDDRTVRFPLAIQMAKRTNADILCLQEVEGGYDSSCIHRQRLEALLQVDETVDEVPSTVDDEATHDGTTSSTTISSSIGSTTTTTTTTRTIRGYDSYVWVPLLPNNKRGDIVGLCIAWRSNRHSLIHTEGYKRGMICQFQEVGAVPPLDEGATKSMTSSRDENDERNNHNDDEGGSNDAKQQQLPKTSLPHNRVHTSPSTFCIANVHLPARPSNILGRLHTMSRTIHKLTELDRQHKQRKRKHHHGNAPLDGLIVVSGDFNSDQHSVTAQLLKRGSSSHGNLRDRNYKAKITKAAAFQMKHPYRFCDVYDGRALANNNNDKGPIVDLRRQYASITVSLHGRGPGCMDQLFFATTASSTNTPIRSRSIAPPVPDRTLFPSSFSSPLSVSHGDGGKRQVRRKKAEARRRRMMLKPSEAAAYHFDDDAIDGLSGTVVSETGQQQSDRKDRTGRIYPNWDSRKAILHVESVLSTIRGPHDKERIRIIQEGLPNVEEGFPSDHLPIGALFVGHGRTSLSSALSSSSLPSSTTQSQKVVSGTNGVSHVPYISPSEVQRTREPSHDPSSSLESSLSSFSPSGVSESVQRRRQAFRISLSNRRRHNAVLGLVTEWLVGRGVRDVVRDTPLYKNPIVLHTWGAQNLKRKSRAPDLVCLVTNNRMMGCDDIDDPNSTSDNVDGGANTETLIVVEVAVATHPERVRTQKVSKYEDLTTLPTLVTTSGEGAKQCRLFTIIVDPYGNVPEETIVNINGLIQLTSPCGGLSKQDVEDEANRFCSRLLHQWTGSDEDS